MQTILLSREEVARRARQLYKNSIRQQVETGENIGKMVSSTLNQEITKLMILG